jgi:hypothetical protein
LRTGAAVLEVVDSVGDIQTIVITTGVNIAAVMPSGARGAIRIALGLRAAVFEEIDSVGDIETVVIIAAVDITDNIVTAAGYRVDAEQNNRGAIRIML